MRRPRRREGHDRRTLRNGVPEYKRYKARETAISSRLRQDQDLSAAAAAAAAAASSTCICLASLSRARPGDKPASVPGDVDIKLADRPATLPTRLLVRLVCSAFTRRGDRPQPSEPGDETTN